MRHRFLSAGLIALLTLAACGGDAETANQGEGESGPSIVVTTNILGDVVSEIVGDTVEVSVVMPVGADPHDFQASAKQAAAIRAADLLIVNGGGFEAGLLDLVEGAEEDGVPVVEALDLVEALDDADPHFFTDPARMASAVEGVAKAIVDHVTDVDSDAIEVATDEYVAELEKLDAEIESQLAVVSAEDRVLVTNHEVFGYFADRYGFEVVGTVVPGGSTSEGGSAGGIAELADVIREHSVKAIFADTSAPDELAQTLAAEVGDVEIVELFSESLGQRGSGGATYIEMMRTNADRIAQALT